MSPMISPVQWLAILTGVISGAAGGVLLKIGAKKLPEEVSLHDMAKEVLSSPWILGGIGLYLLPTTLWIWLLKYLPLSVLQPLLALTYVATALMAMVILRETIPMHRWVGILLILTGVFWVSRP